MQSMIVSQQQLMRRKANDLSYLPNSLSKSNLNDYNVDKSSDEKKYQLDTNDHINEPQSDEPSTSTQLDQENTLSNIKFRRATSSTADYINNRNSNFSNINKRPATSWFNFLPTYKTRAEEFKKYFGHIIPSNERFIVDYSCAYQREILAQGRMYISLNYICFYANILSWETNLVIKCKDIKQISKTNTALIIPNAISIITNSGDKYFFASFVTREKTYSMLYKIWQNSLIDTKLNSNDILNETSKLLIGKELIWDLIHDNYGDLGYTKEEEKFQKSFDESSSKEKLNDSDSSSDSDLYLDSDTAFNEMNNKPEFDLISKQKTLDKNEKFSCLCAEHEGSEIFNETFPMTVDQMFTLAFDDSPFFRNVQKMRNSTVLGIEQWKDHENDDQDQQTNDNKNSKQQLKKKSRELKFKLQLNNALAKYVDVCELQFLDEKSVPGYYYMIYSKCQNSNVPFADTFRVFTTFCFARGSSFKECNLQVHARVEFVKSGFGLSLMKGTIESSSMKGVKDYCDFLSKQLNQWCKEKSLERRQNLNSFKQYKLEYESSNEADDQEADDDDDEDDFILSNDNLSFVLNDDTSLLSKTNSINRKVFNKRFKSPSLSTISTNRLFTATKQQNTPTTSFWKFKQNELILFIIFIFLFFILLIILFIFKRLIDLEIIIRKYEDDLFKFDRLMRITTNLSNQQNFIEFFNQSNSSTILNLAETWANLINQTDQTIRSIKSVYLEKHHSLDKSFNDAL